METVTIKLSIIGKFYAIEIETDKERANEIISAIILRMNQSFSEKGSAIVVKNVAINPRFISMLEVVGCDDIGDIK